MRKYPTGGLNSQPVILLVVKDTPTYGGSVGNLENILTLGREFESRCSHTNWDFSSRKKYMHIKKSPTSRERLIR